MTDNDKPARPLDEKQATTPDVEMENDEGGVPTEADQSDDSDAKGAQEVTDHHRLSMLMAGPNDRGMLVRLMRLFAEHGMPLRSLKELPKVFRRRALNPKSGAAIFV